MQGADITRREHYQSLKQQGLNVEELNRPDVPKDVTYIFDWFLELQNGRQYSNFGPQPFSWTDIKSWAELKNYSLMSWEVDVLKKIDMLFIKNTND